MVLIKLKWNKVCFENVDVDLNSDVASFRDSIFKLTGVPHDRQKLMAKGSWTGTLKDETDMKKVTLKSGQQVILMGSADVIAEPIETFKFIEDLTEHQKAEIGITLSAGLANVGNTCYLNSAVQCLRGIPELREPLSRIRTPLSFQNDADKFTAMAASLSNTFSSLDISPNAFAPNQLVMFLRRFYPQFNERSPHGAPMQQDAGEFLDLITESMKRSISAVHGDYSSILEIELEETYICQETDLEVSTKRRESVNKLVCNIQNKVGSGSSENVDHLNDGVKLWLEGTVSKRSEVLGRDALFLKRTRVVKLPTYLCFQFMRFFWKPTPECADHQGVKCKILRAVSFPETVDVYDLCAQDLQSHLRLNRESEDKRLQDKLSLNNNKVSNHSTASSSSSSDIEKMDVVDADDAEALEAAMALSMGNDIIPNASASPAAPSIFGAGIPSDFTGLYELHSVLTHKGRSADSGHYMSYVRQAPGSDMWFKYDDDKVSEVGTPEILRLKGGGDCDMAYLCFYRCKESRA